MQGDPSNPNVNNGPNCKSENNGNVNGNATVLGAATATANLFRGPHHRRAHSEVSFRIPDDMDLSSEPFTGSSTEEMGSEDDLFSTYIDVNKLGGGGAGSGSGSGSIPNHADGFGGGNNADANANANADANHNPSRPRHRHSNSVDATSSGSGSGSGVFGEIMEAKKAMPPDKLAELWTIDPKRAKRYNFQQINPLYIYLSDDLINEVAGISQLCCSIMMILMGGWWSSYDGMYPN